MHERSVRRVTCLFAAAAVLGGCGGGGDSAASPPAPAPGVPTPPPSGGKWTITLNNHVTAADVSSGPVYGRIGDRAFARTEITAGDLLCTFQTGNRSCTVDVDAGKVLTLAAVESAEAVLGQVPAGGFSDPNWFKRLWQFVSWSAPCAEPERGVCVLQPASNATVTVLWKPLSVTTIGFQGQREWRVRIDAPALLGLAGVHTGLRQQRSYEWPAQNILRNACIGGPTPGFCNVVQAPDTAQITLEQLPSRFASPPAGASTLLQPLGFGGACANASSATGCTLSALGEQSAWFKWEYYSCLNAAGQPNYGDGLGGWKYLATPPDCSLQSP